MRTDNQFNNLAEGTDEYLTPRRKTNTAEKFEEIKQKYARQLTKGCSKTYCTNILCTIDDDVRHKLYILDFLPRYGELFLDATSHLYKRSCPSVRPSVRRSVCPVLFSNIEKRHFRSSDDNQIQQGVRKSLKDSFKDIKM